MYIPYRSLYILYILDYDAVFTIKNIYTFTEDVVDWDGLGLQLGVSHSRLKKIRRENMTEDERRRDMIFTWMNSDPEASWEKLAGALTKVSYRILATKIINQVLPLLQGTLAVTVPDIGT